jgi:hypothetical protein
MGRSYFVMKWYSKYRHPDYLNFIIEHDENVGYYVYLYRNLECFEEDAKSPEGCPNHQDDYLQDTLMQAKGFAYRKLGVPVNSWVEARPEKVIH